MPKLENEVRDAVGGFIRFNSFEKDLIDTMPVQRLRHINQLALTSFVYPGATHKRFEHSLGVMDLAGKVFECVCRSACKDAEVRDRLGVELGEPLEHEHWKQTVRAAALLHDVGHLPFSHAAEKQLLPDGWSHERLTADIIRGDEIASSLEKRCLSPDQVVKLACDPRKPGVEANLSEWEAILNEMITGDTFGVDRMDYLLRDSVHLGVPYGRFDPLRLIDSLTIVVDPGVGQCALAVEEGGLHGAEALLLARYFMYTQVYFHDVRRVYDKHLQQFLIKWLPGGRFPTDWREYTRLTDNEVWAAIYASCGDPKHPCHAEAQRIVKRQHYRTVCDWSLADEKAHPDLWNELETELVSSCGDMILTDRYQPRPGHAASFLVKRENGDIVNSLALSDVMKQLPDATFGFIFADRSIEHEVANYLKDKLRNK